MAAIDTIVEQHMEALTTERGLTRFLELLEASGLDARTRYLAKRSVQLWLGTTLPSGEVAIIMEDPSGGSAAWEQQWRAAVQKAIGTHAA